MKINGIRENKERFSKRIKKYKGERKKRIVRTTEKLLSSLQQVTYLSEMPHSQNRQSNTQPFRRAHIDGDLRLYWWLDADRIIVLHDICNHKDAKEYKDVHK